MGINIAIMYIYMKESIMFFTLKSIQENPKLFGQVMKDDMATQFMLENHYPMEELSLFQRGILGDYFVAYLYLLEGKISFLL